jgi:hypothetical protein
MCQMLCVDTSYTADALHFMCIVTGITHAPTAVRNIVHFLNLFSRLMLICLAVALVVTHGVRCSPGLVIPSYQGSTWANVTHREWMNNDLPGMNAVLAPGNLVIITLWFSIVSYLFITDALKCILIAKAT